VQAPGGSRLAQTSRPNFALATAICVNFAIDCLEDDLKQELATAEGSSAAALERLLERLAQRRIQLSNIGNLGSA
jgi:hypothetical protein